LCEEAQPDQSEGIPEGLLENSSLIHCYLL
jgi:hypothetical protein